MCYCYILYSEKIDQYYVGSTTDLEDRLKRHNTGRSKYTKRGLPWKLVYSQHYFSKSEAYQAEMYIKSQKSRKYIESLIKDT
ncbi:GIY-YIG nuclease family protein [Paludibacter sp. 221]|uniref:GIY-YIG nuclease family protein n=1 Tax=Paludibacter sp. 221 TaxID=2302939 RepID=UPI0013D7CA73|nr:GIY-YIG nuclease family protein [Paludibacter sp. 221]